MASNLDQSEALKKIIQGLAEKEDSQDTVQFDDEAIVKVIQERNTPNKPLA